MFSHLVSIKLIAILVILCRSAHQNNSNYFSLFLTLYLYFASARIDIIILFNYFRLLVLYKVFLKKF